MEKETLPALVEDQVPTAASILSSVPRSQMVRALERQAAAASKMEEGYLSLKEALAPGVEAQPLEGTADAVTDATSSVDGLSRRMLDSAARGLDILHRAVAGKPARDVTDLDPPNN